MQTGRDKAESDLYEANNRINDLLDTIKLKEEQTEYIENEYGRTIEEKDEAIKILLTAFEKEKEKNNKIDEFCRKELAFERRLQRENRQPDEFNQGRFYVSENIRKIIKEE